MLCNIPGMLYNTPSQLVNSTPVIEQCVIQHLGNDTEHPFITRCYITDVICYITPMSCYITPLVCHITPFHDRVLHNTCYIIPQCMLYNIQGVLYNIKCYITPCY